jgi:hypothetical protein
VYIGAFPQEWRLILWGNFIYFMLQVYYVLTSSSRSNYAITTHYRFPALLTLPLHHAAAMSIPFGKSGGEAAKY